MNKEYLEQIKNILETEESLSNEFGYFSKIYNMTTENIYGFLNNYYLKDKKVLTVAGSGDQRLNAYLMGAKEVTCFDINPLTELHLELKDAAISNINFEKFIKFFGIYSKKYGDYYKTFDSRIFDEFKDYLTNDTRDFFTYIISESPIVLKKIYYKFHNDLNILQKMNKYLNQDDYELLKNIIKNKPINFINCDITELPNQLNNKKYDIILLSNISDYTHDMYMTNDLKRYRELIDKLSNNLNQNGILQVGYIYSDYSKKFNVSDFSITKERIKYFPTDTFYTLRVDSYDSYNDYDKTIIYQKK